MLEMNFITDMSLFALTVISIPIFAIIIYKMCKTNKCKEWITTECNYQRILYKLNIYDEDSNIDCCEWCCDCYHNCKSHKTE